MIHERGWYEALSIKIVKIGTIVKNEWNRKIVVISEQMT
jgi:hypothetical protein